jgi:signal peptidase I
MPSRKLIILPIVGVGVIVLGLASAVIIRLFFGWYATIPQNGMYPGMPAGSYFVTKKHPYQNVTEIQRGDVVTFTRTENGRTYEFVWRVVGLPGDDLIVAKDSVSINGQTLRQEPVREENEFRIVREWNGEASYEVAYDKSVDYDEPLPFASCKVPADHVFLLGDNRNQAQDSTYLGPIPFTSIVGKKIF